MPSQQAKAHVKEGYVNKSYSLEKRTTDLVERVASEYGMPRSCVVNIALSRPEKFQKLLRSSEDGETAAVAPTKKEVPWYDRPILGEDDEGEKAEEGKTEDKKLEDEKPEESEDDD